MAISQEQQQGREKGQGEYLDPYSIFRYAMNSPVTRDRYTTRLDKFFQSIGIGGGTIEERCQSFVEKAKNDNNWAFRSIISFSQFQKERVNRRVITGSTIRNYVKAINLFTEMNDIVILWKKITRGLPKGNNGSTIYVKNGSQTTAS